MKVWLGGRGEGWGITSHEKISLIVGICSANIVCSPNMVFYVEGWGLSAKLKASDVLLMLMVGW